jgi:dipeptidyl aminopeptidase/acylaminoacyl peptidase
METRTGKRALAGGMAFACALVLAAAAVPCMADPGGLRTYHALAISPDGARIASVETVDDGRRAPPQVVVRRTGDGRVLATWSQPGCRQCQLDVPAWSPDGGALAVIGSDTDAGATTATSTVYVLRGARDTALAVVDGPAGGVRWSPDGERLAFLVTPGARKGSGAVEAGARLVGEIGRGRDDGTVDDEQRIAVVGAGGGRVRFVSPADTYVYEYDWMPDGRGFVVTSAPGNGDSNWWIATLGHVDAASGRLRVLAAPAMQMNMPRVAPDGRSVAFIGGLMSDFGSIGGDVYTVPLEQPSETAVVPLNLTPGYRATFNGIAWRGSRLLASVQAGADAGVAAIGQVPGSVRMLWRAPVTATGGRDGRVVFSADGRIAAAVLEDHASAPRIAAGRLPELEPAPEPEEKHEQALTLAALTHDNDDQAPQVAARSIAWTGDGVDVQGWLVGPRTQAPGRTYPMIVLVHGGPASSATPRYVAEGESGLSLLRALVARGYFVFQPNPRGSHGQGAAFTAANRRDFGGGDWRDILAGVDAVLAAAPVDPERLGLMGHSYGGFMTMWGVTHSRRFKAAVAGAGIANWVSYYGQNGIDQWMIPYFGASMYEDPAIYRAASPIESIRAARTPTFLYVGERDLECPPPQSLEFWRGLKAQGVPASLVVYEGEGHAIRQAAHLHDLRARILAWFDRYLR